MIAFYFSNNKLDFKRRSTKIIFGIYSTRKRKRAKIEKQPNRTAMLFICLCATARRHTLVEQLNRWRSVWSNTFRTLYATSFAIIFCCRKHHCLLLHNTWLTIRPVHCAAKYDKNCFSILARASNDFHLSVLKGIYITTLNPILCKQKKFFLPLRILR